MIRIDQACCWSLLPIALALIAGVVMADRSLVIGAAAATPITFAAGIAAASRWQAGMDAALGGVLLAVILRFVGLFIAGSTLYLLLPAPMPALAICMGCVVIGVFIDAVLRSMPDKDPVRG